MKTQLKKDIKKLKALLNKAGLIGAEYEDVDQYLVNMIEELIVKIEATITIFNETLADC